MSPDDLQAAIEACDACTGDYLCARHAALLTELAKEES